MKNFEKFLERLDSRPYGGCGCEEFLKTVYQDKNYECPSYDCYVCLAKAMKYLNEEYKEPCPLTHDEYVILKNVNKNNKYLVRDYEGDLEVFAYKPTKGNCSWSPDVNYEGGWGDLYVFNHLFQFIKWEDDEPYSIEKLIADYEKENCDV